MTKYHRHDMNPLKQVCLYRCQSMDRSQEPHFESRGLRPNDFSTCFLKIHLRINGKMPKGYKELIHENTTIIPTLTSMSNSKSPHVATLETTFTHLK